MERVIRVLVADERERGADLLAALRRHYAAHTAADDTRLLYLLNQARAEGRPYDLALIGYDPPLLGDPQTMVRVRSLAPTTTIVRMIPADADDLRREVTAEAGARYFLQPVDPEAVLPAIENLLAERLAAMARNRADAIRPIADLGEALLREPDLERALRRLYEELDGLLHAEYVYVALHDRRRGALIFVLSCDHGEYAPTYSRPFQPGGGLAEWVISHDAPIITGSFPADAARRDWPPREPDGPFLPASAFVMPLRIGGQVIGVISAQSARPDAFSESDATLFSFIADLLSGVVAHWWTDQQWQRQNDLLSQFDRALATGADPAAILDATAEAARSLTGMESAAIIAAPGGALGERYPLPADGFAAQFHPELSELTAQLTDAGRGGGPVDYTRASSILSGLGGRGVGRVVSHAIGSGGQTDAVLWLLHSTERPFEAPDQAALTSVARRGRQALSLAEGGAARRLEREVFARIAWRVSLETSLPLLLGTALNEARKLVPWEGASVWQMDGVQRTLRPLWHEGPQAALGGQPVAAGSPLFSTAAQRDGVTALPVGGQNGVQTGAHGPAVALSLRRSGAQAPGLLVLERAPGAAPFRPEETALLLQLGQILAAGVEKLRFYTLADLHRRLSHLLATRDDEVWEGVIAAIAAVLPGAGLAALAREGAGWQALAAGLGGQADLPAPWSALAPALLADLRPGGPPLLFDSAALARRGVPGVGTLAALPIVAGGAILGALTFWSSRAHAAGSRECEILRHAAGHLAPALLARQPGPAHLQDRRLLGVAQALQQAAAGIADSSGLLQNVLLHALSNTPATAGALLLLDAGDRLALRAEYPQRAGEGLPQQAYDGALAAVRAGQAQYLSSADATLACVPLQRLGASGPGAQPVGALVVGSPRPNAFQAADRELLAHLAAQAASLLSVHQTYEAERALRHAAGLATPVAHALGRLPGLICQALHAPVCLLHVLDRRQGRYVVAGYAGVSAEARALQTLALRSDDPVVVGLFAGGPEQPPRAEDGAGRLWAPGLLQAAGLRFGLVAPFWVDGRPFGIVSLHTFDGREFDAVTGRSLAALAAEFGALLDGMQRERRLEALTALSGSLTQSADPDFLPQTVTPDATSAAHLDRLLRSALELTDGGAAYLLLRSDDAAGVLLQAAAGAVADTSAPPEGVASTLSLREPSYIPDLRQERPAGRPVFDPEARSSLIVPLAPPDDPAAGLALGALIIESPTPLALSPGDERILRALGALTTGVLAQVGLAQELTGQAERARGMFAAVAPLFGEDDEEMAHLRLVGHARQALDADLVVLHPWDGQGRLRDVPPQSGNQQAGALAGSAVMQELVRRVMGGAQGKPAAPLFVDDLSVRGAALPEWAAREDVRSLAITPLVVGETAVGVLFLGYRRRVRFDHSRREAVRLFAMLAATTVKMVREQSRSIAALRGQMQSLSLAAHELREPVDKVHMIIETALNGLWLPMSDTLRERLGVAYGLLDQHYEALGRILQLGRLKAGTQELERTPVAVSDLAHTIVGRYAEQARELGVSVRAAIDPLLAPHRPVLDEALLGVALSNLVQNAVKFSRPGGAVLLTCLSAYDAGRRELVFGVEDQGIGIPEEELDQIFEPYYQVDHSLGRRSGGMGLGLSLVRAIVELHDGALTVESEPGAGSRFEMRLPFLSS